MKILLIGEGAREHIIAEKLVSEGRELISITKRNHPGLSKLCKKGNYYPGSLSFEGVKEVIKNHSIDFAYVSPDQLLFEGYPDLLMENDILTASPIREAARLEWDKSFARTLMEKYSIPGLPSFIVARTPEEVTDFLEITPEVAVKPAGLTGGKGVKVSGIQLKNKDDAKRYAFELLKNPPGKVPGVVLEEKLVGEEFTLQVFTDGKALVPMPLVQDHKLAYEGDTGPNTGGMGSYSLQNHLLPFVSYADYEVALDILKKTVDAFYRETGIRYRGVLYGQFMLTKRGVFLIEFNSRFGDPEALNVLTVLETPLSDILHSIALGSLNQRAVFTKRSTVCKYLVPQGYPENPLADQEFTITEEESSAKYYFASVYEKNGKLYTTTSRTVAVVGSAFELEEAERIAEKAVSSVKGRLYHRKDIATKELLSKKYQKLRELGVI